MIFFILYMSKEVVITEYIQTQDGFNAEIILKYLAKDSSGLIIIQHCMIYDQLCWYMEPFKSSHVGNVEFCDKSWFYS